MDEGKIPKLKDRFRLTFARAAGEHFKRRKKAVMRESLPALVWVSDKRPSTKKEEKQRMRKKIHGEVVRKGNHYKRRKIAEEGEASESVARGQYGSLKVCLAYHVTTRQAEGARRDLPDVASIYLQPGHAETRHLGQMYGTVQ